MKLEDRARSSGPSHFRIQAGSTVEGGEWQSVLTWFMNLAVKLMPNLVGMAQRPRFRYRCWLLNAVTSARRASSPACSLSSLQARGTFQRSSTWGGGCGV